MAKDIVSQAVIEARIFFIRGRKVMLDKDLAVLYGVETKRLNEQVRRNLKRFPEDFMFRLNKSEAEEFSRSRIATLKKGQNIKYFPYAFTENGVAMLSSVLNSERAIEVNIRIMRTFTRLREFLSGRGDLAVRLDAIEKILNKQDIRLKGHARDIRIVFQVIRGLISAPNTPRKRIGFT